MKPTRRNPLFSGFFRKNFLTSAIVVAFGTALSTPADAQTLYWDVNNADAGSGNAGGFWSTDSFDSFWSTSSDGDLATQGWTNGSNAVFSAGTDGDGIFTVNIDGTVAAPSITFRDNGLQTIAGGTINITPSSGLALTSSAAANASENTKAISSLISGSGGLTITSHGDTSATGGGSNTLGIRLANEANVFSGDITIASGLVGYAANSSFGNAANKIIMNGGGLIDSNLSIPLARDIEVQAGGGVVRTWGGVNTTWTGALTGTGNLRRTDGGTLALDMNASAFAGTLTNEQGTLRLASSNWANTNIVQTDGDNILQVFTPGTTSIKSLTSDRDILIAAGSRLDIVTGQYLMNSGAAENGFVLQGQVAADPGSLTSSSGTLTTTSGAADGDLTARANTMGVILENFNGATPLTLVKNNNNALQLTRANTFSGGTVINGGRVNADNLQAFGTGLVTVNDGGQAWLTQGTILGEYTNNFTISGNGVTEAAGTLGAIRFQNSTLAGQITVAPGGARIAAFGALTGTHTGALLGAGNLEINGGGATGTITLAGNASGFTGAVITAAGILNTGALGGGLTTNGGTTNLSGQVSGTTTVAAGSILNIGDGGTISTPAIPAGDARSINVLSGGSVSGNVDTTGATATVSLAGAITGNATIAENGTLVLNGGTIGGGLTGTTAAAYTFNSTVAIAGNLAITGPQTILLNNSPTPGSPATIFTYGGTFTGNLADFQLQGTYRTPTFANTGSAITATLGGGNRTWTGTNATNPSFWDANTTVNWTGGDNRFFNGDAVLFDDTATSRTVEMQDSLLPFSVTFNNSGDDFTIAGPGLLSGSTGITKNGTGTVILGGANGQNYTGSIAVNAGTLSMGSRDAFGQASGVTIASGAAVDLNGQSPGEIPTGGYTYTIAGTGVGGAGAITNTGAGVFSNAGVRSVVLTGNASIGGTGGRFDIGFANTAGFGTINGGGFTLTKTGPNQVVARGPASNVTYVVNEGTLTFENFDDASGISPITVNAGTLNTFGPRILDNDVVLADGTSFGSTGGGAATWNGDLTLAGNANVLTGGNLTLNGSITGSGDISKAAGNILFVQGDNSGFSGRIVNSEGILRLIDANALGSGTGTDVLTIGNSTLEGGTPTAVTSLTLNAGQGITQTGNVTYNPGAGNTMTINGPVTGTGNITKTNNNGTLTFNAPVFSSNANLTADGGVINLNQGVTLTTDAALAVLRTANANVMNLSGPSSVRRLQLATGTMNIGPGANIVSNSFETSNGGGTQSVVNQTGGSITITGDNSSNGNQRTNLLGHWGSGSSSVYNISGGSFTSLNAFIGLGWDSPSTVINQSSGIVTTAGIGIGARNNFAAYNLTGGSLYLGALGINGTASAKEINLGGGTLGAIANWGSAQPVNFTGINGDVLIDTLDALDGTTARNITLSGGADGDGGFVKTGPGTLVLTGVNSYTGTAVINEGALLSDGSLPGTLTVGPNGGVGPGATAIGTSVAELTIGGFSDTTTINGQIIVDLNGVDETKGNGVNDLIFIPGDVSFGANSTILPRFFGGPVSSGNRYTVMEVDGNRSGLPVIDPAIANSVRFTFTVHPGGPSFPGTFPGDILVEVSGDAGDLVWTGATSSLWNTNGDENWTFDSDPAKFLIFDSVTFDDTGDSTQPIELVGSLLPGEITVNASSDYTFAGSGLITGSSGLTKDGSGTLTLFTNNNYNGPVVINGGHVIAGDGGTNGLLGGLGGATVADGASLTFNRSDDIILSSAFTGGGDLVKNGAGTLRPGAAGQDVNVTINSGTFQISEGAWEISYFSVPGRALTVNDGATLLLRGGAHRLGGLGAAFNRPVININEGGVMRLDAEQYIAANDLRLNGGTYIQEGNDLRLQGGVMLIGPSTSGSIFTKPDTNGSMNFFATPTIDVADGPAEADLTMDLPMNQSGIQGFIKEGLGLMRLTNRATLNLGGTITINNGRVEIERDETFTLTTNIAGPGALDIKANGLVTLASVSPAYTGSLSPGDDNILVSGDFGGLGSEFLMSGGDTLTLGQSISAYELGVVAINFADGAGEALDDAIPKGPLNTSVWNSSLAPTSGALANGTLDNLVDANGDPTPISIQWSSANTWGSGSGVDNENSKIMNGYLDDGAGGNTVTISGLSSGGYNIYGLLGSDAGASYTSRDFNVGGTFVYGGETAVSKPAFGTWAGAGEQWVQLIPSTDTPGNYWKVEGLNAPTVTVKGEGGGAGRGPLAGLIIEGASTALEFGQATVNSGVNIAGGGDLTIDVDGINNYDFNGPVTADAAQGVVKTGERALNLNGVSSYTGTTTVAAGTLGGSGTIAGPVVVNSGADINPGAPIGTLSTGSVTFETGSAFTIEVNSTSNSADALSVTGSVTIGSGVPLNIIDIAETPGTLGNNLVFTLVNATGGVSGTFDGLPDGTVITINGVDLTLNYTANTVTLSSPVAPVAGYDDWALQIADPSLRGRGDDADGDGFTNLQEYLFGTSPIEPNGALVTSEIDGNVLTIRWLQLINGADYTLLESATLANPWTPSAVVPADDTNQSGLPNDYIRRAAEVPLAPGSRFYRVEGEEN